MVDISISFRAEEMNYFDFDISKSTNMFPFFDWKTVIYIYACGKCLTQFMLPIEKSVTFTGACVNEIIPSINHSFVYKAKEGCHVRISCHFLHHEHVHAKKNSGNLILNIEY